MKKFKKGSQSQRIMDYLVRGGMLTQLEALEKFGTFRLAARIHDINAYLLENNVMGEVVSERVHGRSYSRYRFERRL